jgi:asparagine synthase (glutamine-hydrolysing)
MCGLAGFWQHPQNDFAEIEALAVRMADSLAHRGPDDQGVWGDLQAGIALAHRRLAILDLSPAGHQPMVSPSGRYVIVFNGEIYNHLELRAELAQNTAVAWRGHSDTETLLAAFETWGITRTLERSVGMFALVLWDRHERALTLARDRMGEKPLYYGWQRGVFLFASELKALSRHPAFVGAIDREALARYFLFGYVPAPQSIYQGIFKLPQGAFLTLTESAWATGAIPTPQPYWSLKEAALAARANPFCGGVEEALAELEARLRLAIKGQMLADVPVGAFLSGGIDSSTVVALMQAESAQPVRTFTIGFPEHDFNEADHARAVARHLGCEHTELFVAHDQLLATTERLPALFDEPFADSSQIPTFLVAQLTREQVTVSLSGDGGDELFAGYHHYRWPSSAKGLVARILALPKPLQRAAAAVMAALPFPYDREKRYHRAHLVNGDPQAIYRYWGLQHWFPPPVLRSALPNPLHPHWPDWLEASPAERMLYFDQMTYLPDDLLVKTDRVAMAVSLESRMPFLDHRLVEWSWRLPLSLKIRAGQGKWLLRQLLYRFVPQPLVDRPKTPFGVPLDRWLRGPLREWAESLLAEERLKREGFLDPAPIRQRWRIHLSGQRNFAPLLWDVLVFQAWLDKKGTTP